MDEIKSNERPSTQGVTNTSGASPQQVICLVAIVLGVAAIGAAYYVGYTRYTALSSRLTSVESQLSQANSQIVSLTKRLNQATSTPSVITQDSLTLTVNSSVRFTPEADAYYKNYDVSVDLTLKNATGSTIDVTTASFKLQDAQGHVYASTTNVVSNWMPSGQVLLSDQSLAPGQSVRGSLVFQVPDTTLTSFTLINGTKSYSITAQ